MTQITLIEPWKDKRHRCYTHTCIIPVIGDPRVHWEGGGNWAQTMVYTHDQNAKNEAPWYGNMPSWHLSRPPIHVPQWQHTPTTRYSTPNTMQKRPVFRHVFRHVYNPTPKRQLGAQRFWPRRSPFQATALWHIMENIHTYVSMHREAARYDNFSR